MKLNLLPRQVAKAQGSKASFFFMFVIIAAFGAATYFFIKKGQDELAAAREPIDKLRSDVELAMGRSAMADTVIAEMTNIDRNIKLTEAMLAHNTAYVDLYREVMGYIPAYYRVTTMAATPNGAESCTVNMTGVIKTHKQYADLVAALYRMPGVTSVTRGGYAFTDPTVPALTEADQTGEAVKPGEANLPSDPDLRMAELIRRASTPQGFLNVNNFGTDNAFKGAMPEWSTVTVSMVVTKNVTTPNPRGTLLLGGTGGAQGGVPGGFPGATGGGPAGGRGRIGGP